MDGEIIDLSFKDDIENALKYWTDLLSENFENIDYIYAKGSAVKPWESKIDYVPMISDVDIHIKFFQPQNFYEALAPNSIARSLEIANSYETTFPITFKSRHIPRMQLIALDDIKLEDFVPPLKRQIQVLYGNYEPEVPENIEELREIDRQNLIETTSILELLPGGIIDRIGIEFWTLIRRICWRVSPSPVRLLNQIVDDPLDTWTWNRTRVVKELKMQGYDEIGQFYTDYYLEGWKLFESGMQSSISMRRMISLAASCISKCISELDNL